MSVLLVSTYDLGRQPFGLASPAAWLRAAGFHVSCVDLSRDRLSPSDVAAASLVAFFLPMHTATRLAVTAISRVRSINPDAHLCCYGLYAPLNERFLRSCGVDTVLGAEFEADLVDLARSRTNGRSAGAVNVSAPAGSVIVSVPVDGGGVRLNADTTLSKHRAIPRLPFIAPDRAGLPGLERYATLEIGTERRLVGSTEASRGCKHLCRHCPIVPVYQGQFRIVPVDVVMADIRAQVDAGARHISFGDPDFFNGIGHALRVIDNVGRQFPGLSYDVTIKIEHLRRYAEHLPHLRDTGCLFVTSAVESVDDRVLERLAKGHTRADFEFVAGEFNRVGLVLSPTFVPFTPWTTPDTYCELLQAIIALDLVDHVAPVQLSIRLLLPEGSLLLGLEDVRQHIGAFDASTLVYPWTHTDPSVDRLQQEVAGIVSTQGQSSRRDVFDAIFALAQARTGMTAAERPARSPHRTVPRLSEQWYCCAEPLEGMF